MHRVTANSTVPTFSSNTIFHFSSPSSPRSTHSSVIDIDFDSPRTESADYTLSPPLDLETFNTFTTFEEAINETSPPPISTHIIPTPTPKRQRKHRNSHTHMGRNENDNDYELRIAAGIEIVKSGVVSIRAAAKKVNVSHETLRRRYQGASSRQEFHAQLMALTPAEELLIESMLFTFVAYSNMLTSSFLCNLVNDYRRQKSEAPVKDLGISWTAGFRRRHDAVSEIMSKSMNKEKSDGHPKSVVDQWYADISAGFEKYNITEENVYNTVELGHYSDSKNNNQFSCFKRSEFHKSVEGLEPILSSVESICGDGSFLPSFVIVKGSNSNLVGEPTKEYGALISNMDGSANSTSLHDWLEYIFEPSTAAKAGPTGYRAIFMDANPALFSAQVLQFALDHRIVFYLFPQQMSVVLQPMDSRILSTYNQNVSELSDIYPLVDHNGKIEWDTCFEILHKARAVSMSAQNVRSAWENTGVVPIDATRAISVPTQSPLPQSQLPYAAAPNKRGAALNHLPATISMNMISGSGVHTEDITRLKGEHSQQALPYALSSMEFNDDRFKTYNQDQQPQTLGSGESSTTDPSIASLLSFARRTNKQHESLAGLGFQYREALGRYLSTRPALYYEDGRSADVEEQTFLFQFMESCWQSIDRATQEIVSAGLKNEEWLENIMKQQQQ